MASNASKMSQDVFGPKFGWVMISSAVSSFRFQPRTWSSVRRSAEGFTKPLPAKAGLRNNSPRPTGVKDRVVVASCNMRARKLPNPEDLTGKLEATPELVSNLATGSTHTSSFKEVGTSHDGCAASDATAGAVAGASVVIWEASAMFFARMTFAASHTANATCHLFSP